MKPHRYCLATIALALFICANSFAEGRIYKIAVIPKGTTHEFWKSIHAGANKAKIELAEKGLKVEIIWKGPLREDDRDPQIQVVENFMTRSMDEAIRCC